MQDIYIDKGKLFNNNFNFGFDSLFFKQLKNPDDEEKLDEKSVEEKNEEKSPDAKSEGKESPKSPRTRSPKSPTVTGTKSKSPSSNKKSVAPAQPSLKKGKSDLEESPKKQLAYLMTNYIFNIFKIKFALQ